MLYLDDDSWFLWQVDAYSSRRETDTYVMTTLVAGFVEIRQSLDVIVYPLLVENRETNCII